ncbi:zinc finger, CCHC-type containing protein [Tanacetum coccineum]
MKAKPNCWNVAKLDDDVTWWVDSGVTVHVCKDRCWFKTYELLNDGSILHMGNESTRLVPSSDVVCVDLRLNIVNDNIASAFMSTSKLNDSILWHARRACHFRAMQDMSKGWVLSSFDMDTEKCKTCMMTKITKKPFSKRETKVLELIHSDLCDMHATPSLGNKKYFVIFIDDASRFCYVYLLHTKDEALDKFKVFKTEVELQQRSLIKRFRTDKGGEMRIECIFVGYAEHSKAFRDVAFWKEAIDDEKDSIMGNNTWVLADLPPGCKPLGYKWIFKRKLKVDGTIEKFKARLVIQGFKQKSGIDYFDTYAPVVRISTIRLLIAMASIHNLIIHQMDVKTSFLNGELDEEVYMNQLQGFIMPSNENKVDLTKELLSLSFSMKDMGEANVILGIRIKHKINGIAVSQSHYIEKVLKKFNYFDCTPVSTPMDTSKKLMANNGQVVSQLEYSRCWKVTLMQAGSETLMTIRLPVAGYSCLVEVQFLGLPRNKLASLVQDSN